MNKKIAFIEDEQLIREGVTTIIEAKTNHIVIYSCASIEEYLTAYNSRNTPDIMLLDIGLPGESGISGISKILELTPGLDIIMFSTYEESEKIYNALCEGAVSYVTKRSSPQKVIDAVNVVANGGSYMSPVIARKVADHFSSLKKKKAVLLSERHMEITKLIAQGKNYIEIAVSLHISHNTVKSHIKRIYELLRVNNKAGLLQKYFSGDLD